VKKSITLLFVSLLMITTAFCQNYGQAVGLRLGAANGISYRRFLAADLSSEFMLLAQNKGTVLTFLIEKHRPALLFDDLNMMFIYGVGVHAGMAKRYRLYNDANIYPYYYERYHTVQLGFDAFASLEYQMPRFPLAVSIECKPYFEIFDKRFPGIHLPVIAFGARYIF
jgi:hypothetical protein